MNNYKRVSVIVMDSVGIGALKDAKSYGDEGTNTLVNISKVTNGLHLPNLEALGLGLLDDIVGVAKVEKPLGMICKMEEKSLGKDTITGHWEMMGVHIEKPFKTFTDTGFPDELVKELEEKTGKKYIGNKSASGTEILVELGERHLETGELILYTSADSVLQIAANEELVPLDELYKICEIAREITMKDEWKVGRVIARPFVGKDANSFKRTPNRHDYALEPFTRIALEDLQDNGVKTIAVGKIADIFCNVGIDESYKSKSNDDGMEQHIKIVQQLDRGLIFTNLVDFDALYGHRRDPIGYKKCLENFDKKLGELIEVLNDDDLLILVADHGNDPTFSGTDHTREAVPMIVYSKKLNSVGRIENRESFADLGCTLLDIFNVKAKNNYSIGESFSTLIK